MTLREQTHLFGHAAGTPDEQNTCTAFDHWWTAYPRKEKKADALKAWTQLKPSLALVEQMVEALAWQVQKPSWTTPNWRGELFVPLPGSWIRGRRWEDEKIVTPPRSAPWWESCAHEPECANLYEHTLKLSKA